MAVYLKLEKLWCSDKKNAEEFEKLTKSYTFALRLTIRGSKKGV